MDNFASAVGNAYTVLTTDARKLEDAQQALVEGFGELGMTVPTTRAQFLDMLEAQNLMSDSGQRAFATMIGLASAFDQVDQSAAGVSGIIASAAEHANAARSAADEFERLFEALSEGARKLRSDALPAQRAFAVQQVQFGALMRRAMSGDVDAMGDVTRAAGDLQSAFAGRAGSGVALALFSARLAAQVQGVADVADELGANKSLEARSLDALIDSLSQGDVTHALLRDQIAALDGLNQSIVAQLVDLKSALTASDAAAAAGRRAQNTKPTVRIIGDAPAVAVAKKPVNQWDAMTQAGQWGPSFAGGGYTGNGPRSGGEDGRGGFWAMMHPRETVIDHTSPAFAGLEREMRETRRELERVNTELAEIKGHSRTTASETNKTGRLFRDWDSNGLPAERT